MLVSSDEYRTKLMNMILFAGSQEDVKRFIDASMIVLEINKVNGHLIMRFVDKIVSEPDLYSPIKKDAQQWSNITMAKILFNRIKHQMKDIAN